MELKGALSNPFTSDKALLRRLSELHHYLLSRTERSRRQPRQRSAKASPVLETISLVLGSAARPMQVSEIHSAAEQLAGKPLRRTSVKAAPAAGVSSRMPRFQRVRRGVYRSTR